MHSRRLFFLLLFTIVALAGCRREGTETEYRTVSIRRGDLFVTISATGTMEPEEVIDVGAQVAGKISGFGQDLSGKQIDYGSLVDEGTILAQIDDSLYAADVAHRFAELEQAKAGLLQAQAKLLSAEADWERVQKIGPSPAVSKSNYDAYRATYEVARATVGVAEATIQQAQASLARAQRNLEYCTIRSPVKGTIIDKRVNIGQTVVSSLNAPSLFLLAKDLTRMEVWVSVNEADIGNIHPGQRVRFTVDAYPGQMFFGTVKKIRLNATMTQNVVTYLVEVATTNADGKLLPYLTANAVFEVAERKGVFLVPNSALRWSPSDPSIIDPEFREAREGQQNAAEIGQAKAASSEPESMLWTRSGDFVRPLKVTPGGSNGADTEVEGEGLTEGMEVIVARVESSEKAANVNPFTPKLRGGGGRRG